MKRSPAQSRQNGRLPRIPNNPISRKGETEDAKKPNVKTRSNVGPVDIPEGEVFILGDNRDFSQDSRFGGNVQIKDIQGKALFIYWSDDWNRIGKQLQ
jgi:signal peptidase I